MLSFQIASQSKGIMKPILLGSLVVLAFVSCNSAVLEPDELPKSLNSVQTRSLQSLKQNKLSTSLALLAAQPSRNRMATSSQQGSIAINALSDQPDVLLLKLGALGLHNASVYEGVVSGDFPIANLAQLAAVAELKLVRESKVGKNSAIGLVSSQGVATMKADAAQSRGALGAGVSVGILSDSFDNFDTAYVGSPAITNAATDVSNGDLPSAGVQVLEEGPPGVDEGRAMAQIIHDVAPAASLKFATAYISEASFANNIIKLADAGVKVMADDIFYYDEPYFQDGIIAQAVDKVVSRGVSYFSAAGNQGRSSYEAAFKPSGKMFEGCELHNFNNDARVDALQKLTLKPNRTLLLYLQWDEPFASVSKNAKGSSSDLDLYLLDENGVLLPSDPAIGQYSFSTDNNLYADPIESVQYRNTTASDLTVNVAITKCAGPTPQRIKYVNFGSGTPNEYNTQSGTLVGHANAKSAMGIAAANYSTPTTLETYSSRGNVPILRDELGNKTYQNRFQPRLTAPDNVDTTFFFPGSNFDLTAFPNFAGSSAAAPHAAGVAALIKGLAPTLPPAAIYALMMASASDIGAPGYDFDAGFGMVNANKAISSLNR